MELVCGTDLLGKGRFGAVYGGTFQEKPVAVKKVQLTDAQIEREYAALQQLEHENVVKLLHVEDDQQFR